MIKCPKCGAEVDIWDHESTVCNECGYEWDLQDEEMAKHRLLDGMKKLYPQKYDEDEESIALDVESILEDAEIAKKKAEWYDKIKERFSEFIANAYHCVGSVTPSNMNLISDLAFSVYNEKNWSKRIQIYPTSVKEE